VFPFVGATIVIAADLQRFVGGGGEGMNTILSGLVVKKENLKVKF
jgi:hypothetical protein